MNLSENINKIGKYFQEFNVTSDYAYIAVKFSDKWTIPEISDKKIVVEKSDKHKDIFYFFTSKENDTDIIFEAVHTVIEYNKEVELKKDLLMAKTNELVELFASKTIEELQTMKFTFDKPKTSKKPYRSKKQGVKNTNNTSVVEEKPIVYNNNDINNIAEDILE